MQRWEIIVNDGNTSHTAFKVFLQIEVIVHEITQMFVNNEIKDCASLELNEDIEQELYRFTLVC